MIIVFRVLIVLSGVLFLSYGLTTSLGDGMIDDFARFGLSQYRRFTGGLEVAGALGLLGGLIVPRLVVVSATGLAILMLLGVITRIRVGDSWIQMLPAVVLLLLNVFLVVFAIRSLRATSAAA